VEASVCLLEQIIEVLKPCPTPGRQHYLFNMKNIISILKVYLIKKNFFFSFYLLTNKKGFCKLNEIQRNDPVTVVSLWRHEVLQSIGNQLPRYSDLYWLESICQDIIKEVYNF
jgi:hypothetical protein